ERFEAEAVPGPEEVQVCALELTGERVDYTRLFRQPASDDHPASVDEVDVRDWPPLAEQDVLRAIDFERGDLFELLELRRGECVGARLADRAERLAQTVPAIVRVEPQVEVG